MAVPNSHDGDESDDEYLYTFVVEERGGSRGGAGRGMTGAPVAVSPGLPGPETGAAAAAQVLAVGACMVENAYNCNCNFS